MNTEHLSRNQTKVLRVFFACFAPSRWKSSPGFTAKPRRAPRFREEKSFPAGKRFRLSITDLCSSVVSFCAVYATSRC